MATQDHMDQRVDVWSISISELRSQRYEFKKILNHDEEKRSERFIFEKDRENFIVTRGCLRYLISEYINTLPELVVFSYGTHGKPYLLSKKVHFNLSHAGEWAIIAIRRGSPVGIDIEEKRSPVKFQWLDLANRFFSSEEIKALVNLPAEKKTDAFFACWTRKESYIKLHGVGLSLSLDKFTVSVDPDKKAELLSTEWLPEDVKITTLSDLDAPNGYRSCIALRRSDYLIIQQKDFSF